MQHQEITESIIGCCFMVYNELGFGFLESVYHNALLIELGRAGLQVKPQKHLRVLYRHEAVGVFIADIVVNDMAIVELKSIQKTLPIHEQQLVNYLAATGIDVGLLINFGPQKVQVKRKLRTIQL